MIYTAASRLSPRRDRLVALLFTLALCAPARSAFSQSPTSGVDAVAAFGAGTLDGIAGGIPPGANTYMGAVRLSVGAPVRGLRLSAETEV